MNRLYLLELNPIDNYVIGGLRNFQAGVDTYRETLFLPDIMKFFALLDLEDFKVCGVFLRKDGEIYFPIPADFLRPRKGQSGSLKLSKLKKVEDLKSREGDIIFDIDPEYIPYIEEKGDTKYEGASGFISAKSLEPYFQYGEIKQDLKTDSIKSISEFIKQELKIGLTLNFDSFTAQESRLYMTFVNRVVRGVKLVALLKVKEGKENLNGESNLKPPNGFFYFGGETRVASVDTKPLEEENPLHFLNGDMEIKGGNLYRFYLTSHTYLPEELKLKRKLILGELNGKSKESGCKFSVEWVFSAGKEWISGFAKPGIQMLKPGTVLILRALEDCKNIKRFTCIQSHEYLPILKGRNAPKKVENIVKEEKNLCDYGWNYGILAPYGGVRNE